jgi:hypothetical protein
MRASAATRPTLSLTALSALTAATLALTALAAPAGAEINVADSIEWTTADADLVVRGTVATVTRRAGPGSVVWYDVNFRVAETLKGRPRRTVKLAIRHLYGDTPAQWLARKNELLLFLVDSARRRDEDKDYARARFALRPHDRAALVLDGTSPGPAYGADFSLLATRADILAAARAAAPSTATTPHRLDLPFDSPAFPSLYGGSTVWLWVPVDARLERLARAWATAPDMGRREEAVGALAHFRSADNIRLVKRLLADPDHATVHESGKAPVHRYLVRARAHQVLTDWGVRHATPVIDEPAPATAP